MTNAEYSRHAYRKAVWAELGRLIVDRYLSHDEAAKTQILCEDVFRTPREVPEDVLMEIADRLRAFELEEERQMLRFELVCRDGGAPASALAPPPDAPAPKKPRRSPLSKRVANS
jgi:hypothetical protein